MLLVARINKLRRVEGDIWKKERMKMKMKRRE